MNKQLSIDEFDALEQIGRLGRSGKPSVCVNRNAKRLCGIKFASYRKDGQLELTEEGRAVLFTKHCIDGLRLVLQQPDIKLPPDIFAFLSRKSFISPVADGLEVTQRGLECLADIEARNK